VSLVEVKGVDLPQEMQRAMSKQAEAEREKRAKFIHAQGELQASAMLLEAAQTIAREPAAIQLRYLQTLTEIGVEKNTTIVFPLPINVLQAFGEAIEKTSAEPARASAPGQALPGEPERPALGDGEGGGELVSTRVKDSINAE
jgi:hypothetical protein